MRQFRIFLCLALFLVLSSAVWGAVPNLINFQGRLTDTLGNPVPDGNYSVTFRIYDAISGGNILWQEGQLLTVSKGLVTTLLGSATPIPDTVFKGDQRWLGIQIGSNPEISPRSRLTSTPYTYVGRKADSALYAFNADLLDGQNSTDYAISGHNHDAAYVNVSGPDSVVSTSGTAFLGKVSGSSGPPVYGIRGVVENTLGQAFGGYFSASCSSFSETYGSYGIANNSSSGLVFGGIFLSTGSGTGVHYGVYGVAQGSSSVPTFSSYGLVQNNSTGTAYGGFFVANAGGPGTDYGVYGAEIAGGTGAAVYAAGDFAGSGAKYAVAKTSQGHRLLSVIESPEVWFEDFGEGQLVNGKTHIELDPLLLETVTINASNPMKVFIQLNDPNCNGTAVVRGTTGFDVVELQNGISNASFSYRIVAKRKGYENQRLPATTLGQDDPNLYPELWQEIEKRQEEAKIQQELQK